MRSHARGFPIGFVLCKAGCSYASKLSWNYKNALLLNESESFTSYHTPVLNRSDASKHRHSDGVVPRKMSCHRPTELRGGSNESIHLFLGV